MYDTERDALCISVSVNGFTSVDSETRASENGYTTTFAIGDRIGITVTKTDDSIITILEDNVPYEYDGSSWNPVNINNAVHRYPHADITYLVYYPYSVTMDGLKSADEIFDAFTPKSDQRNYADYTASDLMTGTGSLSGESLSVTLDHVLSLVEINLFTGSSGVTLDVDDSEFKPHNIGGSIWRCIVKPAEEATLSGQYNLEGVLQAWQMTGKTLTVGTYTRINMINSFYVGNVTVNYTGSSSETVQYDMSIGGILVRSNEMIESIELPNAGDKIHLIGRSSASGELHLRIHGNGDLMLRPADSGGYIPIGSYAEFQLINSAQGALGGNYRQEADLNLMNEPWIPVGSGSSPFAGIYNGAGHIIANLKIDMPTADNIGLFGVLNGSEPQIADLHIISGSIKGNANVGGICGVNNYGVITLCSNAAFVEGMGNNVGGIAGLNNSGNIVASGNSGTIVGCDYVGGVAGNNNSGIIACRNTGTVTGIDTVGGIVGINDTGVINSCYNVNTVNGNDRVGGMVGLNSGPYDYDDPDYVPEIEDAGIVIGCYNTGMIAGVNYMAAVCGLNEGVAMGCYWLTTTAGTGVNNSLDNPDFPGTDTDVVNFTMPFGFTPDVVMYPTWDIGDGSDAVANWKNYDGNGGLPQLWWEN